MATGIRSDSNPIRIGIESESNLCKRVLCKGLQRIAKDCNPCGGARSTPRSNRGGPDVVSGLERRARTWVLRRALGLVPRHAPTAGPRMWFLVWNDLPGRGSQVHSPVGSRNPAGAYLKTCIVTTVYILIMGAIRSFDGRNCEWLIKYTRAVSGPSVRIPWPHRGQRVLKLLRLNPCFPDMRRRRVEARVKFAHVPRCTR